MSHQFWGFACIFYTGLLAGTVAFHWLWHRVRAILILRRAEKLVRDAPNR